MRIDGPIPIHVARAYGVERSRPQPVSRVEPAPAPVRETDAAEATPKIGRLIAGRVAGGVEFDDNGQARAGASLKMYTRAADLVEAAVRVGRTVDLKG